MPRLLLSVQGLLAPNRTTTHEGAAAFDLSSEDPLMHLVFTKGATLLERTYYRTQTAEILSYAKALVIAERKEPGFAWKFAAYMRDPERGKGNRIQGSVAPAILAATDPDGPLTEEYTYRCLRHRADDVALFVAHLKNLDLGEVPPAARRGMARALAEFDEYQLLKYAQKQFPLLARRKNRKRKSLRLVDAMGLCREYLDARTRALYEYLHTSTRKRDATGFPLLEARRRFFKGSGSVEDFVTGRLSTEQALSFLGNSANTWRRVLDVPGLLGDLAFLRNLRAMFEGGFGLKALLDEALQRRFTGVWPHQVYAGYRAMMNGTVVTVTHRDEPVFRAAPRPELAPVFEAVQSIVAKQVLPENALGIADVSGSMFGVPLGGMKSSQRVGDVSVLFAALMAQSLGYAATFSDDIRLIDARKNEPSMHLADRVKGSGGMGGTQVAGAVRHLLAILLSEPERPRPRTLFFFSDMQFHPPAEHTLQPMYGGKYGKAPQSLIDSLPPLDPRAPPLLALLKLWREHLGPIDVVLWNLAAYDNSPAPSGMDNVLLLSGFDANSFRHVKKWQQGPATSSSARKDPNVEIDFIRTF